MNCTEARARLPLLVYDDLPPEEAAGVKLHLALCPTCSREQQALARVRQTLDRVPTPAVRVDLARLYQEDARRQVRRLRRWRRAALAVAGLAAALLLVLFLRLEIRVEGHQLVLRWGPPPEEPAPRPRPPEVRVVPPPPVPARVEERLRVMNDLIHALAADVEERDAGQREALARLEGQFELFRRQVNFGWRETQRLAALAASQEREKKGENP